MKKLLVISGKGGTGKTTVAAALIGFSQAKAAADCDVDAPNLHLVLSPGAPAEKRDFFGAEKAGVDTQKCTGCGLCAAHCRFGAISVCGGRAFVREHACEGCGVCSLVCPSGAVSLRADTAGTLFLHRGERIFSSAELTMGRGNSGKLVTEVKTALFRTAKGVPLAVLDGSPGIGCPVIASISGADLVLMVAEPSVSGMSDLQRLVKTASALQARMAVCVNKYDVSPETTREICSFCESCGIPLVGKIPYDKAAAEAVNAGRSLFEEKGPAHDALCGIYEKISVLLEIQ